MRQTDRARPLLALTAPTGLVLPLVGGGPVEVRPVAGSWCSQRCTATRPVPPLLGVGRTPAKGLPLVRRLHLPVKSFNCSGVCHGTLTEWFNTSFLGARR